MRNVQSTIHALIEPLVDDVDSVVVSIEQGVLRHAIWHLRQHMSESTEHGRKWIAVTEQLPTIDGDAVIGYNAETNTIIGSVRFTTEHGDVYADGGEESGPVWELWTPYSDPRSTLIGPDDVSHWMPMPPAPAEQGQA